MGLSHIIPLILYAACVVSAFGSVLFTPLMGVFVLFPALPFTSFIEDMHPYFLGKDLVNILVIAILAGWYFRRPKAPVTDNPLNVPVSLLIVSSMIGVINGLLSLGFSVAYVVDWKDYMLLPLIWFLTADLVREKKTMILFTAVLVLGFLAVNVYYYNNLKWMNLWHFSYKNRDTFTGLFVYLKANHYGAFFVHIFFVLTGILVCIRARKVQMILLAVMALSLYNIMYSFSRGAYVALLGGLFCLALVRERKLIIPLVVALIFWKTLMPVSVVERVEMTTTSSGALEESAAERIDLWRHAWGMFISSPLYGKGFNTFTFRGFTDTHNYYLKMLAEQGLIGLATFLFLLFAALRMSWRLYREATDDYYRGIGLGFCLCVVSVLLTNFFGNRWSYLSMGSYFWVFMGLMTRAYLNTRAQTPAPDPHSRKLIPRLGRSAAAAQAQLRGRA